MACGHAGFVRIAARAKIGKVNAVSSAIFQLGDLRAIIGDNSAEGQHRAGYNGVWSLSHKAEPDNLFVPAVAGLNFEHIFDGHTGTTRELLFEPRNAPMELKQLSDASAELHQPPTPFFGLESWTTFTLRAPHYVDMHFRCRATKHAFMGGIIGLFWASYLSAPENKSIYFRGRFPNAQRTHWIQAMTQWHNDESTFLHLSDTTQLKLAADYPNMLFTNFSKLRYDEPFYYGLRGKMVYIVMFEDAVVSVRNDRPTIRFSHSPSGGGGTPDGSDTNPAWDFQFIIPRYEVGKEYGFKARVAYKPYLGRDDVVEEFRRWKG